MSENASENAVQAPESDYDRRRREREEFETRIYARAQNDTDVRMLLWQRDSARLRLNLIAEGLQVGSPEPWSGPRNWELYRAIRGELCPTSLEQWVKGQPQTDAE